MSNQPVTDTQRGFAGGLNTVSDPQFLQPNQARQLLNVQLSPYGAAQRRLGTVRTSSGPQAGIITAAKFWYGNNYNTFYMIDRLGNGYTSVLGVAAAFTLNATGILDQRAGMAEFVAASLTQSVMYIASAGGVGRLSKYDFTTFTAVVNAATPACDGLVVYNQRLWAWNSGGRVPGNATNVLLYSNLATAAASTGGDSLGIGASGGGAIRVLTFSASAILSCIVVGASLMIFHERGVSRLTGFGQSDITTVPQAVSDSVSILGKNAVDESDGVAWVATANGLYMVTESGATRVGTEETPDPTVAAIASQLPAFHTSVKVVRARNEVWIRIEGYGVYVYNMILKAWAGPWDGPYQSTNLPNADPILLYDPRSDAVGINDELGYVLVCNTGYNDNVPSGGGGSAYLCIVQCHRMYGLKGFGDLSSASVQAKSWRWVNINATLTTGANAPTVTTQSQIGAADTQTLSTPSSTAQAYYSQASGVGPYIDVTIMTTSNTAAQIESVEVEGFLMGRR